MSGPLVSVVIPTRDRTAMLATALASVAAQGLGDRLECLVVCDDRRAAVPAVVAGLPGLRVLVAGGSGGAAAARNVGVAGARGSLLAFLDDDDDWLAGKLSAQLQALERQPAAVAALCGVTFCRGAVQTPAPLHPGLLTRERLLRGRSARCHLSSLLVRRGALPDPLFDPAVPGSYGEDYDLLLRLTGAGPVVQVPDPLVRIRQHPGSYFAGAWPTISQSIPYLLAKHPDLAAHRRGGARLLGRLAVAQAACGLAGPARRTAWRSWKRDPRQPRAYLAVALSAGVLDIEQLARLGRRMGRSV